MKDKLYREFFDKYTYYYVDSDVLKFTIEHLAEVYKELELLTKNVNTLDDNIKIVEQEAKIRSLLNP
jgi:hypothetical protein